MANPACEVLLTRAPLKAPQDDVDPSTSLGTSVAAGAVVDFWGVVRGSEGGREIEGIEYEAHQEMAEHQLRRIAQQAIGKFPLRLIIIHHRVGFIAVGKSSLFLRVASPHRREAFQASQWIVDELKKKVPIWKRPKFKAESLRRASHPPSRRFGVAGSEVATVK
jgi:molybdopterin synthase catalytic subunit